MALQPFSVNPANLAVGVSNSANAASVNYSVPGNISLDRNILIGNSTANTGNLIIYGNTNAYANMFGTVYVSGVGGAVFNGNIRLDGRLIEPNSSIQVASVQGGTGGALNAQDLVATVSAPEAPYGTRATLTVQYSGVAAPFSVTGYTVTNGGIGYSAIPTVTLTSAAGGTLPAAPTVNVVLTYVTNTPGNVASIQPGDVFMSGFTTVDRPFGSQFVHDGGTAIRVNQGNAFVNAPAGTYKVVGGFFQFQTRGWFQRLT